MLWPLSAISEDIKLTNNYVTLPFLAGLYVLQFDDDIANYHQIAPMGVAGGGNLHLTFNNRYEASFGYNFTLIGDRTVVNESNIHNEIMKSHIFFIETGLTHQFDYADVSLLIGTEKIFIPRPNYDCIECKKTLVAVPEGIYIRPLIKFWEFTMPFNGSENEWLGFYVDYKLGLNNRLIDNQFSIGLTSGSKF
ncbi:MAG: hypothetical protein HRU38_17300 [Saccharospirillaceae bacterium]|nr:hypothetical protein [Pseudomonadales bacterium]NRB80395.1 hypothetical protein [Saccharospirillaceae bacterium]